MPPLSTESRAGSLQKSRTRSIVVTSPGEKRIRSSARARPARVKLAGAALGSNCLARNTITGTGHGGTRGPGGCAGAVPPIWRRARVLLARLEMA